MEGIEKLIDIHLSCTVNKNLSLAGFMSADHKKKLLWGGKKAQVEQVGLFER